MHHVLKTTTSREPEPTTTATTTTMQQGAFVLKIKTRDWRMCVVKQVPELDASSWMLFGQGTNQSTKTTFQLEFKPYQETTLIRHIVDMANMANMGNTPVQLRMVVVTDTPVISSIGSLWALKGLEMYRRKLDTEHSLVNSLHQDMNMLTLSPQVFKQAQQAQQAQQARHSMQTRSKTLN
jgi:hypothetical protein